MKYYYKEMMNITDFKFFLRIVNPNGKILVIGFEDESADQVVEGQIVASQFRIKGMKKGRVLLTKEWIEESILNKKIELWLDPEDAMRGLPSMESLHMAQMRTD